MDDEEKRYKVLAEQNYAAAEGYHKELVILQTENERLRAVLREIYAQSPYDSRAWEIASSELEAQQQEGE